MVVAFIMASRGNELHKSSENIPGKIWLTTTFFLKIAHPTIFNVPSPAGYLKIKKARVHLGLFFIPRTGKLFTSFRHKFE